MRFLVLWTIFSAASAAASPGLERRQRDEGGVCARDEITCEERGRSWCCPTDMVCSERRGRCEESPKTKKTADPTPIETPEDATTLSQKSAEIASSTSTSGSESSVRQTSSPSNTDVTTGTGPILSNASPPSLTSTPNSTAAPAATESKTPTEKFFTPPRLAAIVGGIGGGIGLIALISFLCYRKRRQGRLLLAAYDDPYRTPYEPPSVSATFPKGSESQSRSRSPTPDMSETHSVAGPLGRGSEAYRYHNADALEGAFNRPAPPSRTSTAQSMVHTVGQNSEGEATRPRLAIPTPAVAAPPRGSAYVVSPIEEPRGGVWSPFPPRRPQVGAEVYFQPNARTGRAM